VAIETTSFRLAQGIGDHQVEIALLEPERCGCERRRDDVVKPDLVRASATKSAIAFSSSTIRIRGITEGPRAVLAIHTTEALST
jgi:hypothetical protein